MKNYASAILLASATLTTFSVTAIAEEGNWYLNPAIGYQDFDSDRDLDGEPLLSIGAEYRYGEHWASEIRIMDSSPDGDNGDVDLLQYGIDGIYYFGRMDKFDPYAAVGIGHAEFDGDNGEDNETQYDAGVGFRYAFTEKWSLKADAKVIYGHDDDTQDTLLLVGLSYAFDGAARQSEPVDGDADGVADSKDQCSNTPTGASVDANGCALDSDSDGVPDYKDECPDTPAGRQVDERGCKFVLTSTEEIAINVNFATDSSEVTEAYMAEVEKAANFLKQYADVTAVIEGYTDDTGKASYNESLSQRRADAVMAVLVERFGIAADRLTAKGYGEAKPIESNDSKVGRAANRRVVAVIKAEVEK